MSKVAVQEIYIPDFSQTPLAKSIAKGSVSIQKKPLVMIPDWVKEFAADIQIPYVATVMVLLTLIAFSFGGFLQKQLYTESSFMVSYLDIGAAENGGVWL